MENDYEVVHFHLFNPKNSLFKSSKNEKAEAHIVMCNNKDNCGLYKNKQCMYSKMFVEQCPYGRSRIIEGFSHRASKFYTWCSDIKKQYENVGSLSEPFGKMCDVGEYVYLPYNHINFESELPFVEKGGFFNSGVRLVLKQNFTIDFVLSVINTKKYAMMGGEIKDYQEKVVPLFIKHLSEVYPNLYKELCSKSERAKQVLESYSYVGRKALLKTTNKNFPIKNNGKNDEWFWDGEKITCKYFNGLFNPLDKFESVSVTVVPNDLSVIKITDNNQVNDKTVFLD